MKRIAQLESQYVKDIPPFNAGDTIRVHYKIKEGDKERIQVFQGTVISRRGSGTGKTFTVRKISSGVGVERVFPLYSPNIAKIERTAMGRVRRAKLYYLRGLTGKSARIKEKFGEMAEKEMKKAAKAKAEGEAKTKAKAEAEAKAKAEAEAAARAAEEAEKARAEEAKAATEAETKAAQEAEKAEAETAKAEQETAQATPPAEEKAEEKPEEAKAEEEEKKKEE